MAKGLSAPGAVLQPMQFKGAFGELPYSQNCEDPVENRLLMSKIQPFQGV